MALLLVGIVFAGGASAWTTNLAQLDNGTCGTNLQMGSNPAASSSATPSFWLMGDGGLSSYKVFIDGVTIGTFSSDGYANVCIRTTTALANGSHVLTGNELAPHATNTITPFNFLVDTVAPSAPSVPALASWTDTGTVGDNTTAYHQVVLLGHSDPSVSVQAYAKTATSGASVVGGALADANGNWSIATTTLANNTYTVTAAASDEAGNKSASSGALTLTINDQTTTSASTTTTTKPATTTTTTKPATTTTTTKPATTTTTTTAPKFTAPSAPTGVFAAAQKPHGVALGWVAPYNGGSAITAYLIYRGTSPTGLSLIAAVGPPATSYLDSGQRGVVYYYRVAAQNAFGTGPLSAEVSAQMR